MGLDAKKIITRLALPGILLLGIGLRWFRIGSASFFYDELYNVWSSKLSLGGMLREQLAGDHPPLYYIVARGWYAFGPSEIWTRSLSALLGILTVVFVLLAARELFSARAGAWAAAFATASPLLVWYSRANTYYSFLIAVSALAMWLMIRASLRGGWGNWAAYTVAAAALLFTYFFGAVLVLAGWFVYLLIGRHQKRFKVQWLISQVALIFATGAAYLVSRMALAEPHRLHIPAKGELLRFFYDLTIAPFVLLLGKVDSGIDYSGVEGLPTRHVIFFALLTTGLIAVYLSSGWFKRLLREPRMAAISVFVVLLVAGPLMLQQVNGGSLSGRFFVWAAPAFMMLLAAIVAAAPPRTGAVLGSIILLSLVCVTGWEINNVGSGDADWRALMATIADQRLDGDRLISIPLHNGTIAADYYLAPPMPITGGMPSMDSDAVFFLPPGESWGGYRSGYFVGSGPVPPLSGQQLEERLNAEFSGAKRLWVIEQKDLAKPGVARALAANWVEENQWDYSPIELTLFVPKAG